MTIMASQITSVSIVCWTVCSGTDQRKHQSSASLAFVGGIHRWPVNSLHKGPITWKLFPFDDVIMLMALCEVNPLVISELPLQRASNAENLFDTLLLSWISCWTNNQVHGYWLVILDTMTLTWPHCNISVIFQTLCEKVWYKWKESIPLMNRGWNIEFNSDKFVLHPFWYESVVQNFIMIRSVSFNWH